MINKFRFLILLKILIIFLILACNQSSDKISADNPKDFANITFNITKIGNDNAKLIKFFEKYGYNLKTGLEKYNEIYKEISSDKDKNKIFSDELHRLISEFTIGKNIDQTK